MRILVWVLAILLAIVMFLAGVNKIASSEFRAEQVDILNVPGWFLVLVGVFEVLLAIDLLLPRFRILGAIGVFLTMIGAAVFNLFGDTVGDMNPRQFIPLNLFLALLGLITAWLAADRVKSLGSLFASAKNQAMGQFDSVTDAAADIVT